jgi:hypothetical protein
MKPEPKATNVVCTECGLDWAKHLAGPRKKTPTHEDCVRVLKAELATRPKHYQQFSFPSQSGFTAAASWQGVDYLSNANQIKKLAQ